MKKDLIEILCCPDCGGSLDLKVIEGSPDQVEEGRLVCSDCQKNYPVQDGIPFFKPEISHGGILNQQRTYSAWWDDYHDERSIVGREHRQFFYDSLRIRADEFEGKTVLDAGCGNGRFSHVVSHYRPKLLVSFDISSGLLHARRAISKRVPAAQVAYVQGDMTAPPFKKGVFEVVFSWGVIHHTPDAEKTFSTLATRVKEGGLLGIYVYEFHPLYRFKRQPLSLVAYLRSLGVVRPLRFLCSRFSPRMVQWIFTPIYYLEKFFNFGVVGCHGPDDDRWNRERYRRVVIDRFKTRYASEHQLEEVIGWFRENGFNELRVGSRPRVSVSGLKALKNGALPLEMKVYDSEEIDPSIAQYREENLLRETGS